MTQNQSILETAASWASSLNYDSIPADARRAARYQILNMIAAAHASSQMSESLAVERGLLRTQSSEGQATILPTGKAAPPCIAAAINAAYSMAQDFDDIIWMGHTCHSAVFASLAVAESEKKSTKELITAIVAANEIAGRLAASSYFGPLNGQMTTYVHLISAAAATAKLLNLGATETAHALAISLSQPNFALQPAFMKPSSKLLSASIPIQTGIQAAYLSQAGITGSLAILEDKKGFWSRFSFLPLPQFWNDLGTFWAIQTLTIKNFPGCHYFQTACTATAQLLSELPEFDWRNIAHVTIETTKFAKEVTQFGSEYGTTNKKFSPVNINFDLASTIAVLLYARKLTSTEIDSSWLEKHFDSINEIRKKISIKHRPGLTEKVIKSASNVESGRQALATLRLRDLILIKRNYKKEFQSELASAQEFYEWILIALRNFLKSLSGHKQTPVSGSTIPLLFPSSVTLELGNGTRFMKAVDLPEGSFFSLDAERILREKFIRETSKTLQGATSTAAFAVGLRLEEQELTTFVKLISRNIIHQ